MADNTKNGAAKAANTEKQISVNTQYIKDFSFENPKAPASLINKEERPNIEIGVDVMANKLTEEGLFEVALVLNANAKRGDDVLFVAELTYAGVFTMTGIADGELEQALLIFAPSLLFPFARRILADTTRDGGFPPLMLDPIDFGRLYQQKIAEANAKKEQESEKKPA